MNGDHYEFTGETQYISGLTLRRIRATRDFTLPGGRKVAAGDLGGWIEGRSNLSGDAWVSGEACVYGNAQVYGDALVCDNATVCYTARVHGRACVCDNARVCDNVAIYGGAIVCDNAAIYGCVTVCGDAVVCGNARIHGRARIESNEDYCVYQNTWSSHRWFTYTRSDRMWTVGCFFGTGDELVRKAYLDSELSGRCYEAVVRAQEAIDRALDERKAQMADIL